MTACLYRVVATYLLMAGLPMYYYPTYFFSLTNWTLSSIEKIGHMNGKAYNFLSKVSYSNRILLVWHYIFLMDKANNCLLFAFHSNKLLSVRSCKFDNENSHIILSFAGDREEGKK